MKKTLVVLALAAVLVFAFATVASAKYAGYSATTDYLSWTQANTIFNAVNGVTTGQDSPHGGYTSTSVKCAVCHSVHRAWAADGTQAGTNKAGYLLSGDRAGAACAACHSTWGSNPSDALVEIGETFSGPHIGAGGSSCTNRACHGSVHGGGTPSKYAVARQYNLTNTSVSGGFDGNLDNQMDAAIAAGNVNAEISVGGTTQAMKAYATGYVCFPCHTNSSFSIATQGYEDATQATKNARYANMISFDGTTVAKTGHPSAGMSTTKWVPTCEGCHDMIGVATGTTAWPHANRGIEVYEGRFDNYTQTPVTGAVIANDDATRYTLWMTSAEYHDNVNAQPIAGAGNSLQDGVCIKCHNPATMK